MANLIITVIAIALVAVASLMGAYYGGSAFLNNQAAAGASTVMNEGQQVAGAWQNYMSDNYNATPATVTALVTNNYLQTVPIVPAAANHAAATAVYVAPYGGHNYLFADVGTPTVGQATYADPASAACQKIVKTATGATIPTAQANTAATGLAAGNIASSATYGNQTFGCAVLSAALAGGLAGSGTAPAAGDYVLEYRLN